MISFLIATPLLLGFVSAFYRRASRIFFILSSIMNIVVLLISRSYGSTLVHHLGGWKPPFGIVLVLDPASFYTLLLVNIFMLLVSINFWMVGRYGTVLLILNSALNGFILTGDLFNSFVFLEIITVSAVILSAKNENYYNAFKYLIFGGIAGSLYLLATIFSYSHTGSLNMAQISSMDLSKTAVVVITILYTVGLGVESKLFPLNGWVPGVYGSSALTPTVLAVTVSFSIFYMIARIFYTVFHGSGVEFIHYLAIITIVVGELSALYQKNLLKVLAYSSIAQAGLILAVLSKGKENFLNLAYFQASNEILAKFVLFSVAGFLALNYGEKIGGVFRNHRFLGFSFTTASFSLIGFPLFAGFRSKVYIIMDLLKSDDYILPAIVLFATIIEVGYLVKWNVKLWFEEPETTAIRIRTNVSLLISSMLISIVLVLIFFFPEWITNLTSSMSRFLLDSSGYASSVLGRTGGM